MRAPKPGRGPVRKVREIHDAIVVLLLTPKSAPEIHAEVAAQFHISPGTARIYVWDVLGWHGCTSRVEFMGREIQKLLSVRGTGP